MSGHAQWACVLCVFASACGVQTLAQVVVSGYLGAGGVDGSGWWPVESCARMVAATVLSPIEHTCSQLPSTVFGMGVHVSVCASKNYQVPKQFVVPVRLSLWLRLCQAVLPAPALCRMRNSLAPTGSAQHVTQRLCGRRFVGFPWRASLAVHADTRGCSRQAHTAANKRHGDVGGICLPCSTMPAPGTCAIRMDGGPQHHTSCPSCILAGPWRHPIFPGLLGCAACAYICHIPHGFMAA